MTTAGGGYIAANPDVQASLLVATFDQNAQNVYAYYSNITSNVNCLALAANLAFLSDQNGAIGTQGSCSSNLTSVGPPANGFTVCNPSNFYSNSMVLKSFNSWSNCTSGKFSPSPK